MPNRKPHQRAERARRDRDLFDVAIEAIAGGGSGLAHIGARTVFVPFTIPGERVQVRIVGERDGSLHAEGVRLIDASADRVYPACADYLTAGCVRCGWQHIAYDAQVLLKQDMLTDHLVRVGRLREPNVLPTIRAAEPWAYLHHATWTVRDGRLMLPGRAGDVVPSRDCALIHPDVLALFAALDVAGEDLAGLSKVRLSVDSEGARMIVLSATAEEAPELELDFDASVNLVLPDNEPVNLVGSSFSTFRLGDVAVRATVGTAVRSNVPMLTPLAEAVQAALALSGQERLLDLYAGAGFLSRLIAPQVRALTLVESYPPAATDADVNLEAFDHVDILEGGVEAVLPMLDGPYDAAIVDPPAGLSDAVIAGLADLQVARLVYVSTDAARLAKDARALGRAGYALQQAQAIDLMPQTPFLDSISVFTRQ